jgi:hypothetical protein
MSSKAKSVLRDNPFMHAFSTPYAESRPEEIKRKTNFIQSLFNFWKNHQQGWKMQELLKVFMGR